MLLGGLMVTGCQKELENDLLGIPEGAILLTTEGFHGNDDKTSVDGTSVQWVGGETVNINNGDYTVTVSGGKAYIAGGSLSGAIYGYYVCDAVSGKLSTSPTISVPSSYYSSYNGSGRQVIPLPMVAYSSSKGDAIKFQHVTAAVNVKVKNEISGKTLVLDKVTVTSTAYKLSGTITISHGEPPTVPTTAGSSNTVTVNLTGSPTIAYNAIREVQVPILPMGDNGKMTVEVYCHDNADASNQYHFSKEVDAIALGRNVMLTAGCLMNSSTGNMETIHEVDLSSLSANYTAQDGDVLKGTLSSSYQLTVASGATVTLKGASISAGGEDTWAGITCNGNATIVLQGVNSISTGSGNQFSGIFVPENSTLTISGSGDLTIITDWGAGIGAGYGHPCGNIVIEDGTFDITSSFACAIGCAANTNCGNITISGGNITAQGGEWCAGIGAGEGDDEYGSSTCGNILISGGTHTSIKGGESAAAIGSGLGDTPNYSTCGTVTITGGSCKGLEAGDYATYTIGPGVDGVCGTVNVKGAFGYYTGTSF